MRYFPVRYDPRVVIYERKMFIRLANDFTISEPFRAPANQNLMKIAVTVSNASFGQSYY